MKEEAHKELLLYEEKNAKIFQVMGSLKLLNIKVKGFVKKLEKVKLDDVKKQRELNASFRSLHKDIEFFQEEHKRFHDMELQVPTVEIFARNVKRLFPENREHEFTIQEMRRISVYLYRMADKMLKELAERKVENENKIHEIHAKNGKYYFNRK